MKFKTIKSGQDIKTLLFEEMKKSENEKSLIILSRIRFEEFAKRPDVNSNVLFVHGRFSQHSNTEYYVYENEHIETCECYGLITFTIVANLILVKSFDYFGYPDSAKRIEKIHFIE